MDEEVNKVVDEMGKFSGNDEGSDISDKNLIDIPVDGLIVGLEFDNEDIAVNSIMAWSRKVFCPLVKSRRSPGLTETNGEKGEEYILKMF